MYGDELTLSYDAFSILMTGRDSTGEMLPLTFSMRGGSPPGYVYLSLPFIGIFGPSALGVRALSIVSSLAIILLLYLIGKRIFSEKVGILAGLIAVFSPADINLARGGFETHTALALALAGIAAVIYAKKKPWFLILSILFFFLSAFTYPSYKLVVPLFVPTLIWYLGGLKFLKGIGKGPLLGALVLSIVLGVVILSQIFFVNSERRLIERSVFSNAEVNNEILQDINYKRKLLENELSRVFHNRPVEYFIVIRDTIINSLSPEYLFVSGDGNPRHNSTQSGLLYFAEIPLFALGLFVLFTKNPKRKIIFMMGWGLIAAFPAAFLGETHLLRSSFIVPLLILVSGLGLEVFVNNLSKKFVKVLLVLIILLWLGQFASILEKLYFVTPNQYARYWGYPAKLASSIANQEKGSYDYVLLSSRINDIEYAYPVYNKLDPAIFITQKDFPEELNGINFKRFDNVYIGSIEARALDTFIKGLKGRVLYIGTPFDMEHLSNYEIRRDRDQTLILVLKKT